MSKWLHQIKNGIKQMSSEQITKKIGASMNNHYQHLPQYKAQIQSQIAKTAQKSKQITTKIHEFSSKHPSYKRYQDQMKKIPKIPIKDNVKPVVEKSQKIG